MSKSILYAGNNSIQATAAAGTDISFTNVVRRYGCNLNMSGGNVVCKGQGYYTGMVNLNLDGTEAGNVTVSVLSNGAAVPYATAVLTTTATSTDAITIPFVVRNTCNCIDSTITVLVSGAVTNVSNASILVEKD